MEHFLFLFDVGKSIVNGTHLLWTPNITQNGLQFRSSEINSFVTAKWKRNASIFFIIWKSNSAESELEIITNRFLRSIAVSRETKATINKRMVKILRAGRVQAGPLEALSGRNECVSRLEMPAEIGQLLAASVKSAITTYKRKPIWFPNVWMEARVNRRGDRGPDCIIVAELWILFHFTSP